LKVPYTYLEAEAIERDYDEQVPLKVIVESVNRDFHEDQPVRTVNSVRYVINKIYHEDGWYSRLEETWLSAIN
jgi:hypothetical protein